MYSSESLWSAPSMGSILLLLSIAVTSGIPVIAFFRNEKKKDAIISILLALTGVLLIIPWIVAVSSASKKLKWPSEKESKIGNRVQLMYGLLCIGLTGIITIRGINTFLSMQSTFGEYFSDYLWMYISIALDSITGMVIASIILLFTLSKKGNKFWFWRMILCGTLIRVIPTLANQSYVGLSISVILVIGTVVITVDILNAIFSIDSEDVSTRPQYLNATGSIVCTQGLYAGTVFPIGTDETLCFGSDPGLSHIILQDVNTLPLHMELTFLGSQMGYRIIRPQQAAVICNNQNMSTTSMCLYASSCIEIGNPSQTFILQ